MSNNYNNIFGIVCIVVGILAILFTLGDLLFRLLIGLSALSLINYGLSLRGLPPLQLLIPLIASRSRFFR